MKAVPADSRQFSGSRERLPVPRGADCLRENARERNNADEDQ
jgi:hypothetical protein